MSRFSNVVAVVTGGSSGIGLASTEALVREGARRVYITGRNEQALRQAAERLGPVVVPVAADAAKLSDAEALAGRIREAGDVVDVLFANAGIAEGNSFGATTAEAFDRTFDINVRGLFFTVQTLLPLIRDGGSIVLNASIVSSKGMPNLSVYNASKAAVRSFARSWSNDLKARGIRVNALSPGATDTPIMVNGLKLSPEEKAGFAAYVGQVAPAGRMAVPEEIAAGFLFLADRSSSYVNGIELAVDGGLAQVGPVPRRRPRAGASAFDPPSYGLSTFRSVGATLSPPSAKDTGAVD